MMKRGCQAMEWMGNSLEFGAALDQERLFDVYYQAESPLTRPPMQPEGQGLPPRSMSNLLMPTGIPKGDRAKKGGPKLVPSVPPPRSTCGTSMCRHLWLRQGLSPRWLHGGLTGGKLGLN